MNPVLLAFVIALFMTSFALAQTGDRQQQLARYINQAMEAQRQAKRSDNGSLWQDNCRFSDLASDVKAHKSGDLVLVRVDEATMSQADASVQGQRAFSANSSLTSLFGPLNTTSKLRDLFSPNSKSDLKGQGKQSANQSVNTQIAATVAAVLPNGTLVIEAERKVKLGQQDQTLVLRGLARPEDLSSENVIQSSRLADLELELRGKGVISDATRQPNLVTRILQRLVGF